MSGIEINEKKNRPKIDKIKFRKKYYCQYNCYNCMKYIEKKKRQWETYKAMSGIEIDEKKNQPKKKN